ncbi:Hypothetical predicted protein [Olea europaea subsp. europaea]|uniref:Gamma-interferon-inducible lysosomal thiol reductase n=1 Tax=Olea europaea subsp. europaea TaxID=158383 RepID=A0A8S0QL18_OLEEU|nr:Hypothetical predicted protein [Olea europaea subsp. europaea]
MGSQKQVCGFILTWFLIIWCVCEAKVSLSSTNDNEEDKVNLSLYYESLCPYCASFIVNELVKVFKTDLISIVNLRLVPWGNTQISPNNTWICQHGIDECQLDVAEACAIRLWPSVETHFKFIYCIERLHLMNRHTEWQSCFGAAGFNPTALRNCYINGLGYQDYQNFIAYICRAYRGQKMPQACKSGYPEINSFKIATSSPQVCTASTGK